MYDSWTAGLVLVVIVFVVVTLPCVFIGILGYKMLNKLAYYPSKNPAIQMSIFFWLILVEVVSVTLLLLFYQMFADYSSENTKKGVKNHELDARSTICYLSGGHHRRHHLRPA